MVYNAIASEYSLVYVIGEICPTEVEGGFEWFFGHAHLKPPHVESYEAAVL